MPNSYSSPPTFSIGIPTFNRAPLLQEALRTATHQSLSGVEVVVSDNASTDDTTRVVAQYGSRVLYSRNPTNIGGYANFMKAFEISRGPYFSWLQDDDLIHEDFAQRAWNAFQRYDNLKAYLSFAWQTPLPNCVRGAAPFGPPCGGDWMRYDGLQILPGHLVPPLSLFVTVGFCPVAAFERNALSKALSYAKEDYWLFGERTMLAAAVAHGQIAIDPYIAGVFRTHPGQASHESKRDPAVMRAQWRLMAADLGRIASETNVPWQADFKEILPQVSLEHRVQWAKETLDWPDDNCFCQEVKACLIASLPDSLAPHLGPQRPSRTKANRIKEVLRMLTPPVVWRGLSLLKSQLRRKLSEI